MRRGFEIAAGIASIAGFLLAVILIPGVWSWLYPLPLLVLVSLALIGCLGFQVRLGRLEPAHDQQLLDRLFTVLAREAIRRIEYEDFVLAWPADLLHPVRVFYNELTDVEHEFRSKPIERARRRLHDAGHRLLEVEGMNAIMAPDSRRRYVGISTGELDVATSEERRLYEGRQEAIHRAALDFIEAHGALVRAAKKRGFDLQALDSAVPKPSWTGVPAGDPSPVRARWPGE